MKYAFPTRGSILCCLGLLLMFICASSAPAQNITGQTINLRVMDGQGSILTDATASARSITGTEVKGIKLADNSMLLEGMGSKLTLEITHPAFGVQVGEIVLPSGGAYIQVNAFVSPGQVRLTATPVTSPLNVGFAPPLKVRAPSRTPTQSVGPGPPNDNCAAASPIFDGVTAFTTLAATTDGPDEASCADFGDPTTHNDIWFTYVATCDGDLTVSTCGTVDYDSKINVYNGTSCPPTSLLGCNDDGTGCPAFSTLLVVPVVNGNSYLIRIGGFSAADSGSGTVDIECAAPPPPPPPLDCPLGGILENEPVCGPGYIDVFNGGCNSVPPVFSDIACGDTICGEAGTFTTAAGDSRDTDWYRIVLASDTEVTWSGQASFPFLLGIVDNFGVDSCAGVSAFLTSATGDPNTIISVSACLPAGTWYLFAAPSGFTGVVCGSDYVATASCTPCAVPTGACCFPDGSCTEGTESECIASGGSYQGDGSNCLTANCVATCGPGAGGCFVPNGTPGCEDPACCNAVCALDSFCCDVAWDGICAAAAIANPVCAFVPPDPPANDLCADAIGLAIPSTTAGTTNAATDDNVPFCGTSNTSEGVWYSVIGTGTTITASTCNDADFDTKISVFCSCEGLECVAGQDDAPGCAGFTTELSWCSQAGAQYLILIHGFGGAQGNFNLTLSADAVPCSGAVACLPEGACCLGADCIISTESDCLALGGSYVGDDTDCGSSTYVAADCTNPFEDIAASGTEAPTASNSDDGGDVVPLGFTFNFFGVDHTDIGITSNGYLTFSNALGDFSNDAIPSATDPDDLIAPLWDDFNPSQGGTVQFATLGAAPNRRFIAQWTGVPQFANSDSNTFQAVLFEGSNSIEFHYGVITAEGFAGDYTVGIENADGSDGVAIDAAALGAGSCANLTLQQGQSPCAIPITVIIKAQHCPAPLNNHSHGGLKVVMMSEPLAGFDVNNVDTSTLELRRADGVGGVGIPIMPGEPGPEPQFEDEKNPPPGLGPCACEAIFAEDGILDLRVRFRQDDLAATLLLDMEPEGAVFELVLTGNLLDGTPFVGSDCIILTQPPLNPPVTLQVLSTHPDAWIDVTLPDLIIDDGGFANFVRTYPSGKTVVLTAPATYQGVPFRGWQCNGVFITTGLAISVDLDANSPNGFCLLEAAFGKVNRHSETLQ